MFVLNLAIYRVLKSLWAAHRNCCMNHRRNRRASFSASLFFRNQSVPRDDTFQEETSGRHGNQNNGRRTSVGAALGNSKCNRDN